MPSNIPFDFSQFINPSSFNIPGTGGGNNPLDPLGLDPIGGALFGGLFGDEGKKWQPYIDPTTGNYVWSDPSRRNPVPLANVPGAPLSPNSAYKKMAGQVQAIMDLLPFYSQAISGQVIPQAVAELEAKKITSPQIAQLMLDLYTQFGPSLNKIGTDISRQNALEQATTDRMVLEGPGKDLTLSALELAKLYDPEYFKTRELTSNRLAELMNDIQLGGGLTGSERMEIERSLAQEGGRRGTANAPSALNTVENAMRFGKAGEERAAGKRSELSRAIASATAAMPAFKSGVDVFQVATGKPSGSNTGDSRFPGIDSTAGVANNIGSLANNLMGNLTNLSTTQMQIDAQKKDWADYLNQVTSSIGNLTSSAGGIGTMMGACWIARRVYGKKNPKWKLFRQWLLTKAPQDLRDYYIRYGKYIARDLTDSQCNSLRTSMDRILAYEQ